MRARKLRPGMRLRWLLTGEVSHITTVNRGDVVVCDADWSMPLYSIWYLLAMARAGHVDILK